MVSVVTCGKRVTRTRCISRDSDMVPSLQASILGYWWKGLRISSIFSVIFCVLSWVVRVLDGRSMRMLSSRAG